MMTLSQWLLLAGFLTEAGSFSVCLFYVFRRRDVLLRRSGGLYATLFFLFCQLSFYILAIYAALELYAVLRSERLLFTLIFLLFSLFQAVFFSWFFTRLDVSHARTQDMLSTIVGIIELGNPNLDGHSLHVKNLSMMLYENLPFFKRMLVNPETLAYSALLLDIGKLGVPKSIISKAGKLEKEEWELVRNHPAIGASLLQPVTASGNVPLWIKYHHERVDGSGYYHLRGKEIPLASRIIAVADTFSAITMERSYRPTMAYEDAVAELRLAAGSQLDEELVEIFCNIPPRKIEECMNDVRRKMSLYDAGNFRLGGEGS